MQPQSFLFLGKLINFRELEIEGFYINRFFKHLKYDRKGSTKVIAIITIIIVVIALVGLVVYYYNAYHNLTFELNEVNVANASLASMTLNIKIDINNPNLLPVYIPSGSFTVYLNGQRLGVGDFGSLTIGGNSQGVITAPVTFNATDVPSVLFGIITGGGRVTLSVQGSANLVLFSVPFNSTLYDITIS